MSSYTNAFLENYYSVKKNNPWSFPSQHALMALLYAQKSRIYQHEAYKSIKNAFRHGDRWGNLLAGTSDELVYCLMQINCTEPEQAVSELIQLRKQIREKGFSQSSPLTFCAYRISGKSQEEQKEIIQKAHALFRSLKKSHPFITTSSDIPILILLAERVEKTEELMFRYEEIYSELASAGFSKGSALQSAALALTLLPITVNAIVEQCLGLKGYFKENKLTTSTDFYIILPILVSAQIRHATELTEILEILNTFKASKSVKWLGRTEKLILATLIKSIDKINSAGPNGRNYENLQLQGIFETMTYIQFIRISQQAGYTVSTGVYN